MSTTRIFFALFTSVTLLGASGCAADGEAGADAEPEDLGATGQTEDAVVTWHFFRSPSGRIHCAAGTQLRCDVAGWGDRTVVLGRGLEGKAAIQRATDSVAGSGSEVLAYDTPKTFGAFRCVVRAATGMRCVGLRNLHGFEVSVGNKQTF